MRYAYPTLLLPGIGGGSASLLPLQRRLRKHGLFVKRMPAPPVLIYAVDHYAEIVRRHVRALWERTHRPVTLFGWSLGGLYGVLALEDADTAARVRRFIAFGTPYDGTYAAHLGIPFRFLKGAGDVLPRSPALMRARALINDPDRTWHMITLNGRLALDPLAPYPQRSVRPDMALGGYLTHLAPFTSRALQRHIAGLITRP